MKAFAIAWFLVTLPAIAVILFLLDRPAWTIPAVASLALNSLPFLVGILIVRAQERKGHKFEAH
jgi:archaellum biogenesis protein FlaJ (TadC family)